MRLDDEKTAKTIGLVQMITGALAYPLVTIAGVASLMSSNFFWNGYAAICVSLQRCEG